MTLAYDFANNDANFNDEMLASPTFGIGLVLKDCPVDDTIPAAWYASPYEALVSEGFEVGVELHSHIFFMIRTTIFVDGSHQTPTVPDINHDPIDIVTSNMDVTLLLDVDMNWSHSFHNTPEEYAPGMENIRVWDCKATAEGAWAKVGPTLDIDMTSGFQGCGAVLVRWFPANPPENYAAAAFSSVEQDDVVVGPIGPVATASGTVTWSALSTDVALVMGPIVTNNNGGVTNITATPTFGFPNWETMSLGFSEGYGYYQPGISSSFGVDFEVNDPGGSDGHHETLDSMVLMVNVLRPD